MESGILCSGFIKRNLVLIVEKLRLVASSIKIYKQKTTVGQISLKALSRGMPSEIDSELYDLKVVKFNTNQRLFKQGCLY